MSTRTGAAAIREILRLIAMAQIRRRHGSNGHQDKAPAILSSLEHDSEGNSCPLDSGQAS